MDATRIELGTLRELQLIVIASPDVGVPVAQVTPSGDALLKAIASVR